MALLHQDNSRGGGGPQENRRSLTDFLNFDPSQYAETAATNANPVKEGEEWRWRAAGSPEAAQSPRSLVPSACFPPRNAPAYASFSEGARPGSWAPESAGQDLTELVNSFKSLAMPPSPSSRRGSYQIRSTSEIWMSQSCGPPQHTQNAVSALNMECSWAPEEGARREECGELEERGGREGRDDVRPLSRRASFCGVVSGGNSALRWSGVLPARGLDPSGGWSAKVFMGGLPWDITEQALVQALQHFQPVRVEWPGRDGSCAPRGFAYVTLESERRVRALLAASRRDGPDWYYRVSTRNLRAKEVQVIPWAVCDSNWVCAGGAGGAAAGGGGSSVRLEKTRTVFVGALHGMMTASALAGIMNELFSGVVYAGIDLDKSKYPIGSGRVTFNNVHSYVRAISAGYVEIRTDKFIKKIQVDPYLEDSMCSVCNLQQGPYFCRQPTCFKYFCRTCWARQHAAEGHKPLMRNSKSMQLMSLGSVCNGFTTSNDGNTATPSPPMSGGDVERGEGALLWSGYSAPRSCLGD